MIAGGGTHEACEPNTDLRSQVTNALDRDPKLTQLVRDHRHGLALRPEHRTRSRFDGRYGNAEQPLGAQIEVRTRVSHREAIE
jgi:hypothetical protein